MKVARIIKEATITQQIPEITRRDLWANAKHTEIILDE